MPFIAGKKLSMSAGNGITLDEFRTGQGADLKCNSHVVNFTANPNDPVTNFTMDSNGHFAFDYHGQHYEHEVQNETLVTLGDTATFTDS